VKCSAKDIKKLETFILAITDRDVNMMLENNKYAAHKSIVKATGVPRELIHTPLQGTVPGFWFIVVKSLHMEKAVEKVIQKMTKIIESLEYKHELQLGLISYLHRGIHMNGKLISHFLEQLQQDSFTLL
jgi:hypothetical protein